MVNRRRKLLSLFCRLGLHLDWKADDLDKLIGKRTCYICGTIQNFIYDRWVNVGKRNF